jgi:hypothetical protein
MIIAFFAPGQYPPGAAALVFRRRRCPGELLVLMESAAAESAWMENTWVKHGVQHRKVSYCDSLDLD